MAMESVKTFLWGPSPEQQKAKCNALVRQNTRNLDRDIQKLRQLESKTRSLITSSAKRAKKSPAGSQASKQAVSETRVFAKELVRVRKQSARLNTSKATLQSVGMQVNNAFSMRKIQGSIAASTKVMRDVNTLVRLPELSGAMRELSAELMKAGIIEEMVDDSLFATEDAMGEDDETEQEIEKVLGEVLKDKLAAGDVADGILDPVPDGLPAAAVEEEDDQEEILAQMRGRLEALKS